MFKKEIKAFVVLMILTSCLGMQAQSDPTAPHYKVDPLWPKELPHNWMFGHVEGVVVDKDNHVWVLNYANMDHPADHSELDLAQKTPLSECCVAAPAVIEFDTNGNVLQAWGGLGYTPDWPEAVRGLWVDKQGNVWISGSHAPDRLILKFSPDGKKLLLKIGKFSGPAGRPELAEPNNQDTNLLGAPTQLTVDDDAHEVYIADGAINKRVVVYDSDTGVFKRGWGAYGIPLSEIDNLKLGQAKTKYDPNVPGPKQFTHIEGIRISHDGFVYVTDGHNNRIQIFTKQGKFVKELYIRTKFPGVLMAVDFSRDADQKYMFVTDMSNNNVVWVLNRGDGTIVSSVGHTGRNAGQFDTPIPVALDSHGNMYVGEVKYNNRIQKFLLEK